MPVKKQIDYLNSLQVFSAFCVVVIHTCACIIDGEGVIGEYNTAIYHSFRHLCEIAVPLFLMKSGVLLLNPEKKITYKDIFYKYIKRVLLALLVFGLPMCLMEQIFDMVQGDQPMSGVLINAIIDLVRGHSWSHLWYLYMLITLYLLTPIIKVFINNSSHTLLKYAIIILFFFSSILPFVSFYFLQLEGYYILTNSYLLLFLMGYYIHEYVEGKTYGRIALITALLSFLVIIIKVIYSIPFIWYNDPILIAFSASVFYIFKYHKIDFGRFKGVAKYCFCIYLIHPLFINFAYKYCHFNPSATLAAWWSIPILSIIFYLLSLLSSWVLYHIRILSKNVL